MPTLLLLRIHDGRPPPVPAAGAPALSKVVDDARARQLAWFKARGDEGDVHVEPVRRASAPLAPKATLEVSWSEAVADAFEDVGAREHLAQAGVVPALTRLDLLERIGLEHCAVGVRRVRCGNREPERLEEVAVRAGEEGASHGSAALVKATL